jgi:alanyl-tRNA synthetase
VVQAGSYVGPDRLRFDFTHFEGVKPDQLKEIEIIVNRRILDNLALDKQEMTFDEAKKKGALAFFSEKYGERVRVVDVPGFSIELCGGTHVDRTGDIGLFKITSESSVAAGVRRIEAVTGEGALNKISHTEELLKDIAHVIKSSIEEALTKTQALLDELKAREKELASLKSKLAGSKVDEAWNSHKIEIPFGDKVISFVRYQTDELNRDGMRQLSDNLKDKFKNIGTSGIAIVASGNPNFSGFVTVVTEDLNGKIKAPELANKFTSITGGRGGGRPDFAQGSIEDAKKIQAAFKSTGDFVSEIFGKVSS